MESGKVMSLESDRNAIDDERLEIDERAALLALALAKLSCFENLFDGGEQAVGVRQHVGIKLLSLRLVYGAALERLKVEPDAGNRSFKFVGDRVEEGVLTLVAANFPH